MRSIAVAIALLQLCHARLRDERTDDSPSVVAQSTSANAFTSDRSERASSSSGTKQSPRVVIPRSVKTWDIVDTQNSIAVLSSVLGHHADSQWYIPSLHDDNSEGRNRSYFRKYAYHMHVLLSVQHNTGADYVCFL